MRSTTTHVIKRKRNELLIPGAYVSKRIMTLWKAKELTPVQVRTAALFCYNEQIGWVSWGGSTNFPKGYKVQTSIVVHGLRAMTTQRKPPCYEALSLLLTAELPFREVALRMGMIGSRRTLHREGKRLLRLSLEECRKFWRET